MSLGIFKKLYDMLEESCHELDVRLFKLCVVHSDSSDLSDNNFNQRAMEECQHQAKMEDEKATKAAELEQIEEELPLHLLQRNHQDADPVFTELAKRAFELRRQLQELVSELSLDGRCFRIYNLNIYYMKSILNI